MVRLGEHDLSTDTETSTVDIAVVKVARHPDYDRRDSYSDIALIYMERTVKFTDYIRPICLPTTQAQRSMQLVGLNPFIAGWGKTQEDGKSAVILQELQVPVLENSECSARYDAVGKLLSMRQFNDFVLCAGVLRGGKDACQGDSGGPLMSATVADDSQPHYYQIGIVSYGIGCARVNVPGVYTRVPSFMDWIQEKVAGPVAAATE